MRAQLPAPPPGPDSWDAILSAEPAPGRADDPWVTPAPAADLDDPEQELWSPADGAAHRTTWSQGGTTGMPSHDDSPPPTVPESADSADFTDSTEESGPMLAPTDGAGPDAHPVADADRPPDGGDAGERPDDPTPIPSDDDWIAHLRGAGPEQETSSTPDWAERSHTPDAPRVDDPGDDQGRTASEVQDPPPVDPRWTSPSGPPTPPVDPQWTVDRSTGPRPAWDDGRDVPPRPGPSPWQRPDRPPADGPDEPGHPWHAPPPAQAPIPYAGPVSGAHPAQPSPRPEPEPGRQAWVGPVSGAHSAQPGPRPEPEPGREAWLGPVSEAHPAQPGPRPEPEPGREAWVPGERSTYGPAYTGPRLGHPHLPPAHQDVPEAHGYPTGPDAGHAGGQPGGPRPDPAGGREARPAGGTGGQEPGPGSPYPAGPRTGPDAAYPATEQSGPPPGYGGGPRSGPRRQGWPASGQGGGRPAPPPPPTVDELTAHSLLRERRPVPQRGWRRAIYTLSAHALNPGQSPEDRRRQELIARATVPVRGCYRIAVISLKGGVGKTTTTVTLGATLASLRGDRVIAVDANPDRGTLSGKIPLETVATVRNLLNDVQSIHHYFDVRRYTSQSPDRLEVLASESDPAVSTAFSEQDFRAVASVLQRFYNIVLTDCGTGLLHSAMTGVLDLADQIVLVSSGSVDGARSASATLDWLEAHGRGELVRNSVAVINSVRPKSGGVDLDKLEAHFAARCRAVARIPYDQHLEEGAEVDLGELSAATRSALLELSAEVADAFPRDSRLPRPGTMPGGAATRPEGTSPPR